MNIVVLAGGLSTERDVSFVTGRGVADALRERGHKVILLDVFMGYSDKEENLAGIFERSLEVSVKPAGISAQAPDLDAVRKSRKDQSSCLIGPNVIALCRMADIVFLALHGENGEDGRIQAAFDLFGIRYTGAGYLGSALAMNKGLSKRLFLENSIPTPAGITMEQTHAQWDFEKTGLSLPCVVKPCCGGSSVGISIVRTKEEYREALQAAFRWEEEVILEEYIKGREFSVGVMEGRALPVIEIAPVDGFYNYKNKYSQGGAVETCPADLPIQVSSRMQRYAEQVAQALGLDTYSRMDFLMDENGSLYCLEANTLPGMTPTSLLPQEAQAVGMDFGQLCEEIIRISLNRREAGAKAGTMKNMTLENIAKACHGTYLGDETELQTEIKGAVTDSRLVEEGFLYIPIKGARVDGHDFIPQAIAKGAAAVLSEDPQEHCQRPCIIVPSTQQALKDIARFYREQLTTPIIGITGSVGKTSTKEMIASVLAEKYNVLKTAGNFNNEIGLPLTLLRIRGEHEAAVVEMGISDFGEMHRLAEMAKPDICVMTNIGICHLENLKTRDGILKAKSEIFDYLKPNAHIILNGEDDKLAGIKEVKGVRPVFYGFRQEGSAAEYPANPLLQGEVDETETILQGRCPRPQIYADHIKNYGLKGMDASIHTPQGSIEAHIPLPGQHNIFNAMAAVGVALSLGMDLEKIKSGIAHVETIGGRTNLIETGGLLLIDDCYNANPVSMKASIDVLSNGLARKVAVLGDMGELGENEKRLHYKVGAYVAEQQIDALFCSGSLSEEMAQGARDTNDWCEVFHYEDKQEMLPALLKYLQEGDTVLVKASHFMDYPKIVQAIIEKFGYDSGSESREP